MSFKFVSKVLSTASHRNGVGGAPFGVVLFETGDADYKDSILVGIVFGAIFVIAGIVTWIVITNTLSDQKITVSDDASCRAGATVAGPISAYCQASVIDKHTMEITGGKTYAELERDDPNRDTAMTSSFLQASLFTSVVAFGVAAMAVAIGIAFVLFGLALRGPQPAAARAATV